MNPNNYNQPMVQGRDKSLLVLVGGAGKLDHQRQVTLQKG